jgi:hypothetical protein
VRARWLYNGLRRVVHAYTKFGKCGVGCCMPLRAKVTSPRRTQPADQRGVRRGTTSRAVTGPSEVRFRPDGTRVRQTHNRRSKAGGLHFHRCDWRVDLYAGFCLPAYNSKVVRREAVIHLRLPLPTTSSGLPGSSGGPPSSASCLTLLRVGFTEPAWSPRPLVVSYTTVSPLPRPEPRRSAFCGTVPRVTPGGC